MKAIPYGRMDGAGYAVRGPRTRTTTEDVLEATGNLGEWYVPQRR